MLNKDYIKFKDMIDVEYNAAVAKHPKFFS